ncbi:MAG: DUF2268 domain-containing putative Zn-dependent protease [Patescibacteria group bacterium]
MTNRVCKNGNIHLIGIPAKYRLAVSVHAFEGLSEAMQILKYKQHINVAIFGAEAWEIHPKMHLAAITFGGSSRIDFKICFSKKNIDTIIKTELPLTMYHEVSHVVRVKAVGDWNTLLDIFIDEGIGCFIEQSILPKRKILYIQKIKNEQALWHEVKEQLLQKRSISEQLKLQGEWFYASGELPNWIGYRLGYLIVQKFMSKHHITLDKLARTSSKQILEGSGL